MASTKKQKNSDSESSKISRILFEKLFRKIFLLALHNLSSLPKSPTRSNAVSCKITYAPEKKTYEFSTYKLLLFG